MAKHIYIHSVMIYSVIIQFLFTHAGSVQVMKACSVKLA